ncbi:APC family permease [Ureaplasma diversum]|uniref:APC family permease n=1 Tax=Ureaplasma diversum TaxID=42094 RepID=UPI00056DC2F4
MIDNKKGLAKIHKKLAKNKKVSLMGFVLLTASAIIAFYTFPSLSTAGWIAIIFAFITAMCWFIPIGIAAAELATMKGWTEGGIFTWVRNLIGPRAGFLVTWLQFNVTFGFVAMILFVLSSFSFAFGGAEGYNYINTLKLGTTLNQASSINLSTDYQPGAVYGIAVVLIAGLIGLSLWGQKRCHQLGQFALIIGILLPFAVVVGFSIYTVATLDNPLYFIGERFQKEAHLDPSATGTSYELNKTFMSSTVMASFMAFSFSLHGVEVSAIAANRMENPSKLYPRAMMIVVIAALTCIVIGSVTISMTVPTPTLSFNGGLVQTVMFNLTVGGIDVKLPNNEVQHYKTLAHAYEMIEQNYGTAAANQVMHQFVYGTPIGGENAVATLATADPWVKVADLNNPKINPSQFINVVNHDTNRVAMQGLQAISFFITLGVFVEVSVWMSNLSTGLNYAMRKSHFPNWATYRLKNGSPLTIALIWIGLLSGIFAVYIFGYTGLFAYSGRTITDVLSNEVAEDGILKPIDDAKLNEIKDKLFTYYDPHAHHGTHPHTDVFHHDFKKWETAQINEFFKFVENRIGFEPVASGTPASVTNVSFISNVVSQISMYYIGYNIFLIGYLSYVFKSNYIRREFKIKHKWVQVTLALLAMGVNTFAVVATYLPAAPELYPGKEVFYVFISIALPMFIGTLFLGLFFYLINYWWNKKRGVCLVERPNHTNVDQNVLDVVRNWHLYKDKEEFKKFGRHVQLLQEKDILINKTKDYNKRKLLASEMEYLAVEISTRFAPELDDH